MGYWTDPVGSKRRAKPSKPSKVKGDAGKVVATTKAAPKRSERHDVCGKAGKACKCFDVGEAIPTRRGTPKSTADRLDDNGVIWCGTCNSRTHNGRCMNVTCSTRK